MLLLTSILRCSGGGWEFRASLCCAAVSCVALEPGLGWLSVPAFVGSAGTWRDVEWAV